uniref:PAN2-PAN3 deadenylation complex subunit PAN3 n=1 Tax=Callorhinchus milii TaxID=7868 RepID=A0A4W3HQQ4_CALMI
SSSGGGGGNAAAAAAAARPDLRLGGAGPGGGGVVKFCRYYAKDKTCFYGDECQFLHEEPNNGAAAANLGLVVNNNHHHHHHHPGAGVGAGAKNELGSLVDPGQLLTSELSVWLPCSGNARLVAPFPGMDGTLPDNNLTNSYFSSSFIGVNGFGGAPVEPKYPLIQRQANSSSSPSLLSDCAKAYACAGFAINWMELFCLQMPNPAASEFIPKGGSTPRLSAMSQSNISAFSPALFSHPSLSQTAAGLVPGMSLSAGSSPLHSPKITPHTSPAPRRRSHTPNPANFMVPSSASTSVSDAVSQPPSSGQVIQKETVGGTTYFYTDTTPGPLPGMVFPTYHIYPSAAPHVAYMQPKANAPSFFMSDELRQELINKHLITMAQIDQTENPGFPTEVDNYHSLFPLEPPPANRLQKTSNFGFMTSCYKAINNKDDLPYCLRRIHGFRLVNTKCMVLVDMWKKIQHSNTVTLREVFTTKAFGEHSLVFAYDFHAGSETMMSRHFNDPSADAYFTKRKWGQHDGPLPRQHAGLLPESLIWAYIVQLSSALRTIHTAGLACRVMDPTKILITGKTRLRVNCVGIFDVLTFDNSQNNPLSMMPQYQQADLISLGKVVLALACNSVAGIQRENLQKAMELVSLNYSSDLKNLILYLLTDQNRLRSVNDIMPMIGARFYTQLDAAQMRNDVIEDDLMKEVQNGRLFRLLAKLGTINERPEFQKDPTWSETGDRYLLKLFRDHLFHQLTEAGTPWIDLSHIVSCLNKLDAGVPEKISLVSRDEKSVLVVTYGDLKRCFETAFSELLAASNGQNSV